MATIYELKRRAKELAAVSETNAVDPARVGNLIDDTLELIDEYEKNAVSLGIRKTYATVAAMEADKSPSGEDGKKLRNGQLVSVYDTGNASAVDNGKVFAFQNPGWKLSSRVDAGYARKEEVAELEINQSVYNVTQAVPLDSGYYTAATARAAVPVNVRKKGLVITYQTDVNWNSEQYLGVALTNAEFGKDANWKFINELSRTISFINTVGSYWESNNIAIAPNSKYLIAGTVAANDSSKSYWIDVNGNKLDYVVIENNMAISPVNAFYIKIRHYGSNTNSIRFYALDQLSHLATKAEVINVRDELSVYHYDVVNYKGMRDLTLSARKMPLKMVLAQGVTNNNSSEAIEIDVTPGVYYVFSIKSIEATSDVALYKDDSDYSLPPLRWYNSPLNTVHVTTETKLLVNYRTGNGLSMIVVFQGLSGGTDYPVTKLSPAAAFPVLSANKKIIKGFNAVTDPYLVNNEIKKDSLSAFQSGTTIAYPFAYFTGISYNDEMIGSSIRVEGNHTASTNYLNQYFSIPSKRMKELGWEAGDLVKFGFYARNVVEGSTKMGIGNNRAAMHFIGNSPQWFELRELKITDLNKPLVWNYSVLGTGLFDIRMSQYCVKNISRDGDWFGFEENENRLIKDEVTAAFGENLKPLVEEVFNENKTPLMDEVNGQFYGRNLTNIRRKLRTMAGFGKPKSSIRIVLFADSIWGSGYLSKLMKQYFNETWGVPLDNIDISSACYGGYEVWAYAPCVDSAVIKPNVDLFVFSDAPYEEMRDQIVRKVRQETNADIMIGTWTIQVDGKRRRYDSVVDLAHKYHCELLDINGLLWRKVQDGTIDEYMNGVHPNALGEALIIEDFKKHFESERYYNEYSENSISEDITHLGAEVAIPLNSNIKLTGTWVAPDDKLYAITTDGGIEIEWDGVGFEMVFNKSVTTNLHTILVDGVVPSSLNLEYCTPIIGKSSVKSAWYFHRFFAAVVVIPFMTENETEIEFTITISSINRGSSDNAITSLTYTVSQGGNVLGNGNIMQDSEFVFRAGKIKLPAKQCGFKNYVEMPGGDPNAPGAGYTFTVGDTMTFKARKTWMDTIDTNKVQYLRIAGLKRGKHTMKLTKSSNTETQVKYIAMYK